MAMAMSPAPAKLFTIRPRKTNSGTVYTKTAGNHRLLCRNSVTGQVEKLLDIKSRERGGRKNEGMTARELPRQQQNKTNTEEEGW